jgi:hypothetical protein
MTHKYQLNLIIEDLGEDIPLSGEFSDDDWIILEEFVQYADELSNTKFIQSGKWGELKIEWDQEPSMKVSTKLPNWDDVIVFLHKFRPLLLQNERTNFYKVHNILAKELANAHFRNLLGQYHELYSGKLMQSGFQFRSNDTLINSESILFDWLNSHEYHREKEKQEFIQNLHQMIPLDASKVIFLRQLVHKAIAVFNLAGLIRVVLGKQKSINMKLRQTLSEGERRA